MGGRADCTQPFVIVSLQLGTPNNYFKPVFNQFNLYNSNIYLFLFH